MVRRKTEVELLAHNSGFAILSEEVSYKIRVIFEIWCPLIEWGLLDQSRLKKYKLIGVDYTKMISTLHELLQQPIDTHVYIYWDNVYEPVVETTLENIAKYYQAICAIGMHKFFFNPCVGYVIEQNKAGEMMIGIIDPLPGIATLDDENLAKVCKKYHITFPR